MKTKNLFITAAAAGLSAAVISGMSVSASAQSVIDFEDGNSSFVTMKTDDGGDNSVLSVVDFNGSKQLKVDVQDCSLIPKVKFNINSILGDDNMDKVKVIEMQITLESKDGTTPPGWAGGCIGTQGGETNTPGWGQTPWEDGEYDNAVSQQYTIQRKFLLGSEKFVNGTPDTHMLLMRWGCEVDYNMYVDNIRFLDSSGNEIELALAAGAPAETVTEVNEDVEIIEDTTVQPEETPAEEPEQTASVPASDNNTTSTTTGNASAVAACTALVLAAYGVFMTRKKK
ncbi:MAG: hypothetical protein ACI4KF_02100 [Huintestinicola sp.]